MNSIKEGKSVFLGFYLVGALIYMEIVFRLATSTAFYGIGMLFSLGMVLIYGLLSYFIITLFPRRLIVFMTTLVMSIFWLIYSSQLVYNKIFKTYYTIYSMTRGAMVFTFWREIILYISGSILWIILIALPIFGYLGYFIKKFNLKKLGWQKRLILVLVIILTYIGSIGLLNYGSKSFQSPFDLYYKSSDTIASVEQLGLLTTMRLDIERLVTGWSPVIDLSNLYEDEEESEVIVPTVEYNKLDIDFESLASNTTDETLKAMHQYFGSVTPTQKNEYTGIYEGYNVIVLTAEGFSPYAVNKDLTPTLYKMVHEGYNFENFYTPVWGVSTSDGEYVANVGLLPKAGVWSFSESSKIDLPQVLGNQLKSLAYKTVAYHDHTYDYYNRDLSHPNMGYDYKGVGNGLIVKKMWPASDLEMMQVTVDEYMDNQPFHAYYMTVSGHLRYTYIGNSMANKNKALVADLNMSEEAKAYVACQIELDKALEYLLQSLRDRGIADKTLIALSADHYPYGLKVSTMSEFLGHPVETNFEMYKNNFILYVDGMTPVNVEKPASSLDIIPTISNMLGLEYDSRLFMGSDIFAPGDSLVIFNNRSFISDKGFYNSKTKVFKPAPGVVVDDDYLKRMSAIINAKFYYSEKILETDYFSKVIK
ncbi:MAG: sulfatase-like hydrolase/transferase [Firmicutes bacterium]|nr:sulfatase-like hydrolase/transferase [Bacillota bacterium]